MASVKVCIKMKITPNKIYQFIQGNLKMLGDKLNMLPEHEKEQVLIRASICTDCMEKKKCKYCGCSVPGKLYVKQSCNKGERFPDMMDAKAWEQYKIDNNIEI
jgi:hypothetical protein